MNKNNHVLALSVSITLLIGCSTSLKLEAGGEQNDHAKPDHSDVGKPETGLMTLDQKIEHSRIHLAQKLSVDPADIRLAGTESVNWRSGAMGCPKPGVMYTQALVPGVLIMLSAKGKAYRYHSSLRGNPFYCPNSRAESPSASAADI